MYFQIKERISKDTDHKEVLPLVWVGQQEETQDSGDRNLEIKGLAMKLDEGWVDLDVIATTERQDERKRVIGYDLSGKE